jgi:HK97 family phage prohead protease
MYQLQLEVRAHADVKATGRTITGFPIVFDALSLDLGGFREIIEPSAVDRTLRENLDIRALVDHSDDPTRVIGRRSAGTLRLAKQPRGLQVEIDVPETSIGNDTLALVRRGDVTGMSFSFRVMPNGDRFERRAEGPVRVISDMQVRDISIVTYPAYTAADVQVAKRSLEAWQAVQTGSRIDWLRRRAAVR